MDDSTAATVRSSPPRAKRYRKALELVEKWAKADDDYDERVWPMIERELEATRSRSRSAGEGSERRDETTS